MKIIKGLVAVVGTAQLIQHNYTAKPTAVTVGSLCTAYTVITDRRSVYLDRNMHVQIF